MKRAVSFSPEAENDLLSLYDYIFERSGGAVALGYIGRIEEYCRGFDLGAERGTMRDDVRRGLRTVGFERRVTIAFEVTADTVTIVRILYGGRDLNRAFDSEA